MQKKNVLELVGSTICPFVQRVQIALLEKNLEYQFINIDLANKPSWLKDISPYEKVPVLKSGNSYLYESTVINEYLEDVFPNPTLMPTDPILRADMRIWINFFDTQYLTNFFKVLLSQDEKQQDIFRQKLLDNVIFMEKQGLTKLSNQGPYWFGEQVTLVDIALFPFFERFPVLTHYRNIMIPEDCERLRKWIETMQQRPSILKTANTLETHMKIFAKYADNSANSITSNEMRSK